MFHYVSYVSLCFLCFVMFHYDMVYDFHYVNLIMIHRIKKSTKHMYHDCKDIVNLVSIWWSDFGAFGSKYSFASLICLFFFIISFPTCFRIEFVSYDFFVIVYLGYEHFM